ncbi:MAG TPA: single-stranded-DNA-specific exonuclease RecJ [Solirubrobacteraceae bacterium]|jgi:single-stranded-DNA-specific exonuclease|nr:single-stranded-DNA-specific exonuclease RecJ [Solirubrobacteraceae bacterium]
MAEPALLLEPSVAPVTQTRSQRVARRIMVAPYDLGTALRLEQELGIGHVLAQVLVRRGYSDPDRVRELLDPTEDHPPDRFQGIERAVELIERHVRTRSRIVVHGDYDVDGVCATALLVRAIRSLGGEVAHFIPSRSEDGYGLSPATVTRLAGRGTGLLITVDCGITAVEEVAAARAAGLDVVVTDHHSPRPDGQLPECPLVHPAVCGHPSVSLCGTAVAHKLAQAIGAPTASEDLELVALATVADLMPLQGENRRLVRQGLAQLAGTARPGLRALMEVSGTDPSDIDASALGFRLAPRINASGRLRRADAALELLLTEDPARAREIAEELDHLNSERRFVEQRIGWEAEALAAEMGERPAYVLAARGWHPGVVGIVASRIVEHHHRPAILIALDEHDLTLPGQGSGRSIPGFDLLAALDAASPHLLRYGGHRAAAGLSVLPERIEVVREAIERHAEQVLTPDLLQPVERVDAVVSGAELTLGLAEELLALEPCGLGNPGVNLLVSGARFHSVRPMGDGRHARFSVSSGGVRATAVSFGCDGRVPGDDGEPMDATFRLERNVWQGRVEPRLVLREAAGCATEPIRTLGEPEDYLAAVFAELKRPLEPPPVRSTLATHPHPSSGGERTVLDRRGESPLAVITDARAAGDVLIVCADTTRRLKGLSTRVGGLHLASFSALAARPALADRFDHLVVIDPPCLEAAESVITAGNGYSHLAWGEPELRFAQQMHELEYAVRPSLVALYRSLRQRGRVSGQELEHLLRGEGPHPRSPALAGRLVRVLVELELVSLDPDLPALAIRDAPATDLERSAAYRVYSQIYEDGLRFLSRARPRASA